MCSSDLLPLLPAEDERGVRRKGYRRDAIRARLSRFFYEDRVEPVTPPELAAAQAHAGHAGALEEHDGVPHALPDGESARAGIEGGPEDATERVDARER